MRIRRAVISVLALAGTVVLQVDASDAYFSWRTGRAHCMADNSADSAAHGFWFDNVNWPVSQAMRNATYYTRQVSYDPTDLNTFDVNGYAPDTDVWVLEWDIGSRWCGYWWDNDNGNPNDTVAAVAPCWALAVNPANACEQFLIAYDSSYLSTASVWEQIAFACHEIGHTVGLHDRAPATSTGCMADPIDSNKNRLAAVDIFYIAWFY